MDMWESLISILMMGATFLYMINKAHFAQTRRVALVPLGFCAVDMLCAGTVPFGTYPVIAIMLVILRLTVLLCCAGAMHKDTVAARRAAHRKRPQLSVRRRWPLCSRRCVIRRIRSPCLPYAAAWWIWKWYAAAAAREF